MTCNDIDLSLETPYIFYGNNKSGDLVSRFLYSDDDIELSTDSSMLTIAKDSTDSWALYLNDCSYIIPSACKCEPYVFPITITLNGETITCNYSIYITSIFNADNAVSMVGTYPQVTLHVTNLPIVDAYGRTPCNSKYDSTTAEPKFHVLLVNKSETIRAEHSSFETRFCQIFYNSIKISYLYRANELFADGDEIVIKIKNGVDEYGNDTYDVHDTTVYPDGTTGPIKVRRVQKDNTLTLEMPVDFTIEPCSNEFIVEVPSKQTCTEIAYTDLTVNDDGTVTFNLDESMFPVDEDGNEQCGITDLYISSGTCDDDINGTKISLIRYKYDGSLVDGNYTSGTQCIYSTPISLNYETTYSDGTQEDTGVYGKTVYVKVKDASKCCEMVYNHVRVKYNENLSYRHGKQTLNNIVCREGDIVWLTAQYNDAYDSDGNRTDGNGLWIVHENADWRFYSEVTDTMFIDLGASVTEDVSLTCDTNVGRKYGNYWLNGVYLSSGTIVNLQNQDDANGLYRVTCGDWEYLGSVDAYSGTTVDATDDIVTYNDIDFCTCGIYHIWYYYLNDACVLNTASRTVKVVGKCGGKKEGTLVPGNKIRITDYRISTEVDDELLTPDTGDSDADACTQRVESFDNQYSVDLTTLSSNCFGPIIVPGCTSENVCDHTYWVYASDESTKYDSSDYAGFSMVFWVYEDSRWVLYALVGNTSTTSHSYVAYRLDTYGYATTEMVDVSDWFIPSDSYSFAATYNDHTKVVSFSTEDYPDVSLSVGDVVTIVDDATIQNSYTATVSSIKGTSVSALLDDAEDLTGKNLTVVYGVYSLIVPGMTISDASWEFSKSLKYPITIIGEGYKSGKINYNDDGVSVSVSVAGKYSKGYITYNPDDYVFTVGQTIMAASSEANILSLSATVTSIEVVDDTTYKAYVSFDEKVPQKTVTVDNGVTTESYKSPVDVYTVVGNELNSDTIAENWSIRSNTTKIFIPKSYAFRYYSTAISEDEFVDIFNSYAKWKCITSPTQYLIMSTDDSDNTGITDDTLDGENIIEIDKKSFNI